MWRWEILQEFRFVLRFQGNCINSFEWNYLFICLDTKEPRNQGYIGFSL